MASRAAARKDDSNVVELRKNTPTEDGVIALNLAKIQRAGEALQAAKNDHQSVIKHAEAKGIDLKAAAWAIKLRKSGKLEEAVAEMVARVQYAYILGTPLTKAQLDLFRVEMPRTPSTEKAKEHGRYTGLMGFGTDQNPYAVDSEQGQAWLTAFHEGTNERNLILSMESDDELISGGEGDDEPGDDDGE